MWDCLPEELVEKIILRLPIKPLLQSTTLSKKWYKLITSPSFISAHLTLSNSLNNATFFLLDYYDLIDREHGWMGCAGHYAIYSKKDETFQESVGLEFRGGRPSDLRVVGCCNGLVCLYKENSYVVDLPQDITILYNPLIRRSLRLPNSNVEASVRLDSFIDAFGFVHDYVNDDYKVLRVCSWSEQNNTVEIFRLSMGLWEDITHKAPLYQMCQSLARSQAVVKGIAHWVGADKLGKKLKIVSFHVHEEVFGITELPKAVLKDDMTHLVNYEKYLLSFDESLFLIRGIINDADENGVGDVVDEQTEYKFDIWKMEEYGVAESWKRLQTRVFNARVRPLNFSNSGEIIWLLGRRDFIATNLENDAIKHLSRNETETNVYACSKYVESLVLLDIPQQM